MYRRWKDSKGKDKEYEHIIRKQVQSSRLDAEREGISIPTTMEEYLQKAKKPNPHAQSAADIDDFYHDDYDMDDSDDEDDVRSEDHASESEHTNV